MRFRILGTAAGGGLPQWNCACPNCQAVRNGDLASRLQASAVFSVSDSSRGGTASHDSSPNGGAPGDDAWYVINATPDLVAQLTRTPELHPKTGVRQTPIAGVILTDGEFDHILGLLHLREGANWTLYATQSVVTLLERAFPVLPALERYVAGANVQLIAPGTPLELGTGSARVTLDFFETGHETPRYAQALGEGAAEAEGAVVGLMLTTAGGRRLAYAPGVSRLTPELFETLRPAEVVLFDGTLYEDDELGQLGIGEATARDMGHVPMGGPEGSAAWLTRLPAPLKRYVHINNTNPALQPASEARALLHELELDLAEDGWEITL